MWGKPKATAAEIPAHITRRVGQMSQADLQDWADQAIYTTGRYLSLYTRTGSEADLDEAISGAQVLLAIVSELKR